MGTIELDVAILGAGSAGLSARSEVEKVTQSYRIFDGGELGTTCARVGCMPSKALIQAANDVHTSTKLSTRGVTGAENISIDGKKVMAHVRSLRDRFVRAVLGSFEDWQSSHLVPHHAQITGPNSLRAGGTDYHAKRIVIATGSKPIVPSAWSDCGSHLSTSDDFFEWEDLPRSVAVIGFGVIGSELGQALARLGVQVQVISKGSAVGGLTEPTLQSYALEAFQKEFSVDTTGVTSMALQNGQLLIETSQRSYRVEKALVAIGRRPQLSSLGLENIPELAAVLNQGEVPPFDEGTHRIKGTNLYIAGDVDGTRPLLHEASDEGWIAGFNAARDSKANTSESDECFARRVPLSITFTEPNIAVVGQNHQDLTASGREFITGKVCFEGYGRAIIKLQEVGLLHVYACPASGEILGAEMFAPGAEHLAHLVAWAVSSRLTVDQALAFPFYHPVLEEGLKTALRDAREQLRFSPPPLELFRCQDAVVNNA